MIIEIWYHGRWLATLIGWQSYNTSTFDECEIIVRES